MVQANSTMVLTSTICTGVIVGSGTSCLPCQKLGHNPLLEKILERMEKGISNGTTYAYYSIDALIEALKTKNVQLNHLRFQSLNQARQILRGINLLGEHKRLLHAIAQGSASRIDRVVDVALKQKRGVAAILEKVIEAGKGVYKVKSFTERDRLVGTLLWRLGGDRVGHIVHRALGLPGVNTLREGSVKIPITPSAGKPTIGTVERNTLAVLEGLVDLLQVRDDIQHMVVMVDEIACEKRVRWYSRTNEFLGLCREHGPNVSLKFENEGDMEEMFRSIDAGEVHYASEVRTKGTKLAFPRFLPPLSLNRNSVLGNGWRNWTSVQRDSILFSAPRTHLRRLQEGVRGGACHDSPNYA